LKQAEINNQNALSAAEIRKRKRLNQIHSAKLSDRETLCDQFRPRKASQVLGNANEATYLRDWLSALGVGARNGSGPKVVRRVPKRKHKLDDWIVDDIGTFDNVPEEAEGEAPEPYEEPFLELGQRPATYAPLSAWLTNTILLSGPSGSGKSAAVYAAASELGWEVFEVYPGIGKRTGGNLMSLVGDVGKNHMVNKGRDQEGIKPSPVPLKTFFESAPSHVKVDANTGPPIGSQGEPIEVDDDHHSVREVTPPPIQLHDPSLPSTPFRDDVKFRQSLILLEEVDILFDEEATFWPAVISLIAESKRPVVMTCNGRQHVRTMLMYRSRACDARRPPTSSYSVLPAPAP
jgi:DNA polymerase III delta prime subunit